MSWGVSKKLSEDGQEIWVLVKYGGGEEMSMSAFDYLATGYDPPLNRLPWSNNDGM